MTGRGINTVRIGDEVKHITELKKPKVSMLTMDLRHHKLMRGLCF